MKNIKVSIIGAGTMSREYLNALNSFRNIKLESIYSRTFSKANILKKKYGIEKSFQNIDLFCKETNSDILIIAISEESLLSVFKKTCRFNWIHLIEKPIGVNLEETLKIYNLAKQNKSRVFVALNRRFYHSTNILLSKIKKTQGKRIIKIIDQQDTILAKKLKKDDRVIKNWMYANSIHLIDYLSFLSQGKISKITSQKIYSNQNRFIISANIKYDNGDFANYYALWNISANWSVELNIDNKLWTLKPLEKINEYDFKKKQIINYKIQKRDLDYKPGLKDLIANIILERKGKINQSISINEALKTVKLIDKIYNV